ncbi:putative phosphatidylethanolamine N-methyltransferase [Clavispora lusitaniae]|uniref:Phosphatidylethanolamine N-methyltransferase n=1 Tax=Clavispora lusitaniae TaxID=36911 RepID=A0ACD0WPZ3_CLALS|nr:putative phosphatidylethanolamine N-methyltransferase [Clavispora lusitaniae]QFZ35197.1 putative phosphatidylethanolamine N-methyltransferase [Clavispora lusitaniae]QFZ40891.1 putative phosphatidylethanolamine N-methyltransferase [Clavispora lusitaniae]QFZ46572.1 putative phosphatidylethanolamine N-methyltransferase [Clavispora lusitaniae]QFZ52237.1 putative phosphatidylethanolamine N-methyltransferase [Clavispora lusitaniae]
MSDQRKGITFDGETFTFPETNDMVKTLFDPTVHKSACELIIVTLLVMNSLVFYSVSNNQSRINIFVGMYIFWRLCYNFGIGFLLNQQSNRFRLVKISEKMRLFDKGNKSFWARCVQTEVQSQMGPSYSISAHPVAFNTWLIFRKVVDLILMEDFITFMCVVVACAIDGDYQFLHGQPVWLTTLRLVTGIILIVFNFWVKVNAHNTIKDYAWYWGDFFFRQINNDDLIFDGVFEMFPHPMYSAGYVGYYGFALIAKSYTVLIVAVFGHFLQMVFLHLVENPHIDKIYGPPPNETSLKKLVKLKDLSFFDNVAPLVGLVNFNILRASDIINLLNCLTYAVAIPTVSSLATYNIEAMGKVLFCIAILIKGFESFVINGVLLLQSNYKTISEWYLANNLPVENSLNNFAVLYNSLINLTYSSFVGMNVFKLLTKLKYQDLIITGHIYLRIFLGLLLIITQVMINTSIVDSIGYFGWFYGDFFIPKASVLPQRAHLSKGGVYRYLNNPEQIFGVCGVMGVTMILPTYDNFMICLLWMLNNFFRINFVERSHMIKIYGEREVSQDSGVMKTVKKHLLPESIQKKFEVIPTNEPKKRTNSVFIESFDSFIKELRSKNTSPVVSKERLAEMSQNEFFSGCDYCLEIEGLEDCSFVPHSFIGEPIEVKFRAPAKHSPKDWVGLYKVAHTSFSRYRTLVSSNNRWDWTGPEEQGTIVFSKEKLFCEEGLYEFRYHLDGKHDVAFISAPFEIKLRHIEVPLESAEADELANELRKYIFDHVVSGVDDNETPIFVGISQTQDIVATYEHIAMLITKSTGVKVGKRFLFYNDNETGNKFTVGDLASRLINIKKVMHELEGDEYLRIKKLE